VSELTALTWRNVRPSGDADQVTTVFGKGSKTWIVLLSVTWRELQELARRYGSWGSVTVAAARGKLNRSHHRHRHAKGGG